MTSTPRLLQVGITCRDIEQTAQFYIEHLGFRRGTAWRVEASPYSALLGLPQATLQMLRLHLGAECLELTQVIDPGPGQRPGQAIPADSRSCDLWFQHICLVTRDLDAALQQLKPALSTGLAQAVSRAPQTLPEWNTAAAGIRAFKFRDPDSHNLELLQFPAGKGDARWHQEAEADADAPLLLGIDHSAISIADTPNSCRFYEQLLGLQLGGDGVNSGPTQDDLDGLQHTEVRITSHRCRQGAGIECLNYLPPNRGRVMPADLEAQDLAHWQLRLAVDDLPRIVNQLAAHGGRLLSHGIVALEQDSHAVGGNRAVQVSDPDGHRLQLVSSD